MLVTVSNVNKQERQCRQSYRRRSISWAQRTNYHPRRAQTRISTSLGTTPPSSIVNTPYYPSTNSLSSFDGTPNKAMRASVPDLISGYSTWSSTFSSSLPGSKSRRRRPSTIPIARTGRPPFLATLLHSLHQLFQLNSLVVLDHRESFP